MAKPFDGELNAEPNGPLGGDLRWYQGVTRYQWLVLVIASLGWIFDVFEGQIFVASMNEAMPALAEGADKGRIGFYNKIAFAGFLVGGALGGILFGALSDRIGRKKTLSLTIIFYSVFTCFSAFAMDWWHMVLLRFLVAMGVGGEWAVATALVAEVVPERARTHMSGIFHASSVFGTYLAVAAGVFLIGNESIQEWADDLGRPSLPWRLGFALGAIPALLIIWVRASVKEPEKWIKARQRMKDHPEKERVPIRELLRHSFVGLALAAVGMATFWGVHVFGKDKLKQLAENRFIESASQQVGRPLTLPESTRLVDQKKKELKRWEMWGMFLTTTGGGIGLVCFAPICQWLGRRGAFLLYHLGGLVSAIALFHGVTGFIALQYALPIFGFLTLGMHAGYAIYFPELYPTRLRSSGAGFCFNGGRILAAPILFLAGWMQLDGGYSLTETASMLSGLFLLGVVVLLFAPETKGRRLME